MRRYADIAGYPNRSSALWRTPVPIGIARLSITLTVGATAVVFAAIKSVLIQPLLYARPEELVQIRTDFPRFR